MTNIFLVKSPLQLLNAIEAKYHFKLDEDDSVLIIMGDSKSRTQIINLAKMHNQWANIILLNAVDLFLGNPYKNPKEEFSSRVPLFRSSFFNIWRINRLAKYVEHVNNIFVGDINYVYMRHFLNITPHEKTVLLDDGTATIDVARKRREGEIGSKPKLSKKLKLAAKTTLQGLKDQHPQEVCFFSTYDVVGNERDEAIKNNFEYLRSQSCNVEKIDTIYFLGSPLYEGDVMTKDQYLTHVKRVVDYFKGQSFLYVAHRREDKDKLEQIKNALNIEVCFFDYPIEYQLAMVGPRPAILASFVSSALDNLRLIMGDQLKIISFSLTKGTYKYQDRVDSIYAYYEANLSDYFLLVSLEK